jgi:hypothetical protein
MQKALRSVLFASLILVTGMSFAQSDSHSKELSQQVHFELGETHFLSGDSITIDSIRGTEGTVAPGNLYEIKGRYTLTSHPNAQLAANVTSRNAGPTTTMQVQHVDVDQGSGTFTVYLYMPGEGWPHLSFYPTRGGSSFSALYFGNGKTLMHSSGTPAHDSAGR